MFERRNNPLTRGFWPRSQNINQGISYLQGASRVLGSSLDLDVDLKTKAGIERFRKGRHIVWQIFSPGLFDQKSVHGRVVVNH